MNNLTATLGNMRELQAALSMQREVVEKRKQILGEEHPNTVSAMRNFQNHHFFELRRFSNLQVKQMYLGCAQP